jgi:hypothetical protein
MQTALQKLKEKIETQKEFYGTRFPQFISWIDELIEYEQNSIIDFGNKMQMVRDVDYDGNVGFMFSPENAFIQIFKNK